MSKKTVFIYGSCVSRDTYAELSSSNFELNAYVARQSLISAMSAPSPEPFPNVSIDSNFRKRMLLGDWHSSLLQQLQAAASSIDLLMWDLFDERLGIMQSTQIGSPQWVVTRSVDSISADLDPRLTGHTFVRFGGQQHRQLFATALSHFRQRLDAMGLRSRVMVIAPRWATNLSDGSASPASFGVPAAQANRSYRWYYKCVSKIMNVPILSVPECITLADSAHRWGAAPFHYVPEVYQRLVGEVLWRLDTPSPPTQ